MKHWITLFMCFTMSNLHAQEDIYEGYMRQLDSLFQTHAMIKAGAPWQEVYAHLEMQAKNEKNSCNYRIRPDLAAIAATIRYRSNFPEVIKIDTASVDALIALLMDTLSIPENYSGNYALYGSNAWIFRWNENSPFTSKVLVEILKRGKPAIPALIRQLDNGAATRTIVDNGDSSQEMPYAVRVHDYVLCIIEYITQCDFLGYSNGHLVSNQDQKEQQNTKQGIIRWWAANELSSVKDGIIGQLENQNFTTNMCQNLAALGEQEMAIDILKKRYNKFRLPEFSCFPFGSELQIARVLETDFNIDVALEDCANGILNYRCYDNFDKVSYIMTYDSSGIWYRSLAEVVATEPYTTFDSHKDGRLWKQIFSGIAVVDRPETLSVLLQLLKRKELVHERNSRISAYSWDRQYPDAQKNNFRVCDFALLHWLEMANKYEYAVSGNTKEFRLQLGAVDYTNQALRDNQIAMILEKFDRK